LFRKGGHQKTGRGYGKVVRIGTDSVKDWFRRPAGR
jgi:hypothetical protein